MGLAHAATAKHAKNLTGDNDMCGETETTNIDRASVLGNPSGLCLLVVDERTGLFRAMVFKLSALTATIMYVQGAGMPLAHADMPTLSGASGVDAPTAWDRPPPRAVDASLPPAARGFQAAFRSGVQLPWGDASEAQGDELGSRYAWQLPLLVDAGFKLQKPLFFGLYAGIGFGKIGSSAEAEAACASADVSCRVVSYQLGLQGQYHFRPAERLNPWLGCGFGYEVVRQSLTGPSYSELQQSSGVTLLKVGFGIDYRSSFGFGPFIEASAGRFAATSTEVDGKEVHEGPVNPSTWHGFLTLGARLVVLP